MPAMPDPPAPPAPSPAAPARKGAITRIAVTYTVNTDRGLQHTFHGLPKMRRHLRPERLAELLDELTVICEELLAVRPQPAGTGLPPGVVRLPLSRYLRAVR
jgi:hypothetical protein